MKLHANAALSLNKRRQLCDRVVDEAWSVSKAAETAEVSVQEATQEVPMATEPGSGGTTVEAMPTPASRSLVSWPLASTLRARPRTWRSIHRSGRSRKR